MSNNKKGNKNQNEIQCLYLIENQVQKKLMRRGESSYCPCSVCMNDLELREKGKAFLRQTSSILKVDSVKMQEFFGLLMAINSKIFFKLDIAEICFFSRGEIKRIFKSNNCGIHQLEIAPSVKKNLINLFMDTKKSSVSSKDLSDQLKPNKLTHIKYFGDVIPSYRHGKTAQQKMPKTFIFHNNQKYDDQLNLNVGKVNSEESCVVKYKDKGFQLVNQKQLRQLLGSLVSLQNVEFIQKYIKPHETEEEFYYAHYDMYKSVENAIMLNRSLLHVKIELNLVNSYSREYIPIDHLEEYENLLKDIPQEYCLYQNYKMIHYMELAKDVKIEKMNTAWVKDQTKEICFFGLMEFQWRENQKLTIDVSQIYELKELINTQLTDFESELMRAWEHMKERKHMPEELKEVDEQKEKKLEEIRMQSSLKEERKRRKSVIKK